MKRTTTIRYGIMAGIMLLSITAINLLKPQVSNAQSSSNGQIMFILDASSSMLAKDGTSTTRFDKAKSAIDSTLASLPQDAQVGLRVYGSEVPDTDQAAGCQDTRLIAKPAANNISTIRNTLSGLQPKGWTLMGKALQETANDFSGEGPKTVILVSDGIDTCKSPPACDVAKTLTANGVDVKINTLGLLVDQNAKSQLTCIAQNGGGQYYDVSSINDLESTLRDLTRKEVELFSTQGIPVTGSLRIDNAPQLEVKNRYKSQIVTPQQLYYKFRLSPGQKVTVTVKAVGQGTSLGLTDYLVLKGYSTTTESPIIGLRQTAGFDSSSKIATESLTIDTNQSSIQKLDLDEIAIGIGFDFLEDQDKGATIPLEISFISEGGEDDTNDSADNGGAANAEGKGMSPLGIVFTTLGVVALLAAIGFAAWKYRQHKQSAKNQPTGVSTPSSTGNNNPNPPEPPISN